MSSLRKGLRRILCLSSEEIKNTETGQEAMNTDRIQEFPVICKFTFFNPLKWLTTLKQTVQRSCGIQTTETQNCTSCVPE